MMFIVFLFLFFIQTSHSFLTQSPIWKTSIYFRAGQQNVINTLTGNDKTPNYTFTFSSALSGTPSIAYGIGKYQGIDYLMEEYFEIFRIGLTSTSFSVAVQITGSTSLYILRVPYLAIEPTFPHHLNTFDNIPVNYSAGNLVHLQNMKVNITSRSLVSQTIYQNVINYTQQCGSRTYNKFNSTLQNYKITLLMTSLFVSTVKETSVSQNYSMDLRMSYTIMNESFYLLKVRLKINVIVTRLRFSQIVFDATDIASSNKYRLIFEPWEVDNMGGTKEIPVEFKDNFIMAISQFTTPHGYCGFDYMWDWKENSTFFGVQISESITRKGVCAFNRIISAVVYIETWKCLSPFYYYNASTGFCQDECGLYFYGFNQMVDIELEYWCKPCQWGCSKCSHSNKCISCNSDDMRVFNGSCYCPYGYLDTYIVTKCQPCVDPNCMICQKNLNFDPTLLANDTSMNASKNLCVLCVDGYYLNQTTKICFPIPVCNSSLNQLLNYETYTCQQCQLEGCLQCRQTLQLKFNNTLMNVMQVGTRKRTLSSSTPYGIVTCALCDQNNQYFMNLTTKQCQLCQIDNCLQCSSLYTCFLCDSIEQYFLNNKTKQCEFCKVQGCEECINLTTCRKCDNIRGYFLDQETKSCTYCGMGCNECVLASNSLMSAYCRRCESELFLIDNRCFCPKGYYLTVLPNEQKSSCVACDPVCKRCQNSTNECTGCYFQQNRILTKNNNTCECNATNYIEQLGSNTCKKVNLSLCDMGYYMNEQTNMCKQICGDGVRIGVQCDDGNNINRDGCSIQCKVEADFVCSDQMYELSECNYTGQVRVGGYNVSKSPYENVFILRMRLQPQLVLYKRLLWRNRLRFQVQGSALIELIEAVMVESQILQVKGRYFENIKHLSIRLKFINTDDVLSAESSWVKQSQYEYESESQFLSQSQPQYQSPQTAVPPTRRQSRSTSLQSPAQTTTTIERHLQSSSITTIRQQQQLEMKITFTFIQVNIDFTHTIDETQMIYYQQSLYRTARHFSSAFNIIIIVYLVMLFPTLFFSKRISTVLVVSIGLQLGYTSLISIPNINPLTYSIMNNLQFIYGVNNLNVFDKYCTKDQSINSSNSYDYYHSSQSQYSRLSYLGFSTSCLLRNMNLMVVFQIIAVIAILLLRLLQIRFKRVIDYVNVFKRALNNLVYFNLSNTVISICMIDWNHINQYQIAIGTLQLVLTVIHMVLVYTNRQVYLIQVQIEDFVCEIGKDKQIQQQQDEEKEKDKCQQQQQSRQQQQQFQQEIRKQELYQSIKQQRDSISEENTSSSNQSNTKIQLQDGIMTQDFRALLNPSNQQRQQGVNKQLLYFSLYTIGVSIISPLVFVFLNTNDQNTLISNLITISLLIILITLQVILNPFKSSYSHYHSFTKLSTNYYLTYTFVILILIINLLFYLFQHVFSQQPMQEKISVINIVAYFQLAVFLLFFAYFTIAQFYAVYFSFFQKQVLKSYFIAQNDQKSSFKSQKNVNSTRLSKSQQNQPNHSMNKRYQYSINRNIIPKPLITSPNNKITSANTKIISAKTKITKSSSKSEDIIFQIDENEDQVQKYRF